MCSRVLQCVKLKRDVVNLLKGIYKSPIRKMHLIQFIQDGKQSVGAIKENGIVNLSCTGLPDSMVDFLKGGEPFINKAKDAINECKSFIKKEDVKIMSPITNCKNVICIGLNYKDHCEEQNTPYPKEPIIFNKFPTAIIGDGDDIILPDISDSVDWEVELAVVIGKGGKYIKASEAIDHVAGYTVANDVSARDWQMKKNCNQWLLGKTFDTFCPLGPVLATKNSIPDPHVLPVKCSVNGEVMQESNTNQLVFDSSACIEWVSRFCTLTPGDIILTGTPGGVGVFRKPPIFLNEGDVVTCEIGGIGKITNKVAKQ